jgi:hypothetical protein
MRVFCALLLSGCGLTSATAPGGLDCDRISVATDKLDVALASAVPNDCVILTTGTYIGAFELPKDVSLAGAQGATVTLKGDGSGKPVLTVRGGKRSTVRGLKIDTSDGTGIAIDPGPANLVGVVVSGDASHQALTSTCELGSCDEVTVEDSELTACTVGLLVSGGIVHMKGGRIADMAGNGLSDGSGVVAAKSAQVTLEQVTVENNHAIGVLIDGASTHVTLDGTTVRGNLERGVWIQNATDGGVTITGGEVSANGLVGIGIRDSAGITLSGLAVNDTRLVEVPIGISGHEMVGDGVGFFSGARDISVDGLTASGNGRAQILADACGEGVHVTAPQLSGGQFRVVVQGGAQSVDVPAMLIDNPGRELGTKSDAVPVSQ